MEESIIFPLTKTDKNHLMVQVNLRLYAKESIASACYKFTDQFYIHQQLDGEIVNIVFEPKEGYVMKENVIKQFCNELIDQQVRYNTNQQFGHIRDLIVEEAFKPVSK